MKNLLLNGLIMISISAVLASCGGTGEQKNPPATAASSASNPNDPMQNKGIGTVTSVTLGPLDPAMAQEGQAIFQAKCTACHKISEKFIGPAVQGVTKRRTPEWIMNMILSPDKMIQSDPIAKQLLIESNLAPMANQHLTEEEARKILEYFRTLE